MAMSESSEFNGPNSAEVFGDDQSASESVDVQHYLRILRKYKWSIMLFSALVTALAAYYAYTTTPVYSSTSTLLIESQGNNLVQFEELVGLDTDNQDYYQTQFELLRSRGLAVRVVNHMELWNHPELSEEARLAQLRIGNESAEIAKSTGIHLLLERADSLLSSVTSKSGDSSNLTATGSAGNEATQNDQLIDPTASLRDSEMSASLSGNRSPSTIQINLDQVLAADQSLTLERQRVINNFMSKLSIVPVRKTKLVKISFESTDPVFAALVANTVGEQYIESYLDAKLELTTRASRWLNERLSDLKGVLESSEDRLITFKQEQGLVDVDGSVGRLNEQELLLATAELAQARSALAAQSDLYREVQNLGSNTELLESIPAIQADPLVQRVKIEQGQAQRALDELRNRYGDRHPRVVDANSQLATLNSTLQGHLIRVAGSISKDYQLARQRVATIESKLATGKQEIQALGTKKFELDELEREVETNREIYNAFFSRITEARSADGLETANARISDAAVPAIEPVKPKKQLIIALAALASLVLSMLMAVLYEQMDDTIKSTGDIEEKLNLKLLGILPLIKGGLFSRSRTLPLNPLEIVDAKGRFSEAVNTARTALCMGEGEKPRKVVAITSSVPGEGKSSTAINLAYSLGQLERVLLIDCDLRRPTIAKAAGLDKNTAGLSNLITKSATASECIKQGVFGGTMDILPSGPIHDQPLEFLSSKRFENIVTQLSVHYDRIILDCAPTQAVSDALVISRLTDAMIYCVKSHDTSIELVRRGIKRLSQINAPLAGVIITQVDIDKITAYGGDYYYQGYYDYYGYTEKGDAKVSKNGRLRLTNEELHSIRNEDNDIELDLAYMEKKSKPSDLDVNVSEVAYDDYDQTAQFDFNASQKPRVMEQERALASRKSNSVSRSSSRLRGDLDIL